MAVSKLPKDRVQKIIERHQQMKAEKAPWLPIYELIGKYVMTRKQHFTSSVTPGEMQNDNIFDDTAVRANQLMAASIIGAAWPNGAKSFQIDMPFNMEKELAEGEAEEVKDYYQTVTKVMANYMDSPKAGLLTSLEEYMLDQGAFGISGVMVEDQDDTEVPIVFKAVDAKVLTIDEGKNGFVDTIYIEKSWKIRNLIEEYGYDNVAAKWQKLYENGDAKTEVKVLQAIEPRMERDPYGFGVANMPVASIHIDISEKKVLRESGFLELPGAVTRFWKAMGEKYGRCPAMAALPSILEANALGEAWIIATEKTLDPPLAIYEDGSTGGGTVDTSAGALNVINVSGRISGQKPIEPMFLVGDLQWTAARRTEIAEGIGNHFFQDRLTGLGKQERMQNPETQIVNELRGQSLNTTYSRQYAELFVPLIDASFHKLRRKHLLGVIPGTQDELDAASRGIIPFPIPKAVVRRMMTGQEVYRINFISPATRIMQAEELQGINSTVAAVMNVAQVDPSALDILNVDNAVRRIQELTGAPRELVNSMDVVKQIRAAKQKQAAAVARLESARVQSEIAKNNAHAAGSVGINMQTAPDMMQQGAA